MMEVSTAGAASLETGAQLSNMRSPTGGSITLVTPHQAPRTPGSRKHDAAVPAVIFPLTSPLKTNGAATVTRVGSLPTSPSASIRRSAHGNNGSTGAPERASRPRTEPRRIIVQKDRHTADSPPPSAPLAGASVAAKSPALSPSTTRPHLSSPAPATTSALLRAQHFARHPGPAETAKYHGKSTPVPVKKSGSPVHVDPVSTTSARATPHRLVTTRRTIAAAGKQPSSSSVPATSTRSTEEVATPPRRTANDEVTPVISLSTPATVTTASPSSQGPGSLQGGVTTRRALKTKKQQVLSRPTSSTGSITRGTVSLRMADLTNPSEPYKVSLLRTQQQKAIARRSRQPRKVANVFLSKYPVLRKVAEEMGFDLQETEEELNDYLFNLCWSDSVLPLTRLVRLGNWQRTNHFPAMYLLCRKGHLTMTIGRMRRQLPAHFTFYPRTWTMRTERTQFTRYYSALSMRKLNKFFIVKPNAGCQGRGIVVTRDPFASVEELDNYIVQEYVPKPLLIEDRKFDLRIYVLLTSIREPSIFMFNDGLVRMCAEMYEYPTDANAKNTCKHLTNYAVNKHSTEYVYNTDVAQGDVGHKRNFKFFNRWLEERGHDSAAFWERVGFLITKTTLAAQPQIAQVYNSCFPRSNDGYTCFELLGFDILVDSKLKPWLIEVNHTPSFATDTPLDYDIKSKLLVETWDIVDCKATDYEVNRQKEREEFTRRNIPPWASNHPLYVIQQQQQQQLSTTTPAGSPNGTTVVSSPTIVGRRASFSSTTPSPPPLGPSSPEDGSSSPAVREVPPSVLERRAREDSKLKNFTRIFPSANEDYQLVYNAIRTVAQTGVAETLGGAPGTTRTTPVVIPGAGTAESNALQRQLIGADRMRRDLSDIVGNLSANAGRNTTPIPRASGSPTCARVAGRRAAASRTPPPASSNSTSISTNPVTDTHDPVDTTTVADGAGHPHPSTQGDSALMPRSPAPHGTAAALPTIAVRTDELGDLRALTAPDTPTQNRSHTQLCGTPVLKYRPTPVVVAPSTPPRTSNERAEELGSSSGGGGLAKRGDGDGADAAVHHHTARGRESISRSSLHDSLRRIPSFDTDPDGPTREVLERLESLQIQLDYDAEVDPEPDSDGDSYELDQ